MEAWWIEPLRQVFAGRRVVLAGAVATAWAPHLEVLRAAGITDALIVATDGAGAGSGSLPDTTTVVLEPPPELSMMEVIHRGNALLLDPPPPVREALERFDPNGEALVVGSFLNIATHLHGRPFLAHRRPEWVALEDKVVVDGFWDRAGIVRQPSAVVDADRASDAAAALDQGDGTVWAADATGGFNGGASGTWWVTDDASRRDALDAVGGDGRRVRVMPFLEGIPCSVHGIVVPDGIAVLRPVELVVLRRDRRFVYAGCATFWDPPAEIRDQMRDVCRRAGERLATEVGYRGTYTVDGIAAADGFWPTEVNPRFGGGIMTIARAADLPIVLLNDLIVAGHDLGRSARRLEEELLEVADAQRGGGTWIAGLPSAVDELSRSVLFDDGTWEWAPPGRAVDGHVIGGGRFVRCTYEPATTPIGPSTAARAAAFWDLSDRHLSTAIGSLTPAHDPF